MSPLFLASSREYYSRATMIGSLLREDGWNDITFDLDHAEASPLTERPYIKLEATIAGCSAALFLISREFLRDGEFAWRLHLVRKMGKPVFIATIDGLPVEELPSWVLEAGPAFQLDSGNHEFQGPEHKEVHFSAASFAKLKIALARSYRDPFSFDWPAADRRDQSCFRGLEPLQAKDAGIFFGRDPALIEGLERLRILAHDRGGAFVLLGAPGSGKSSFVSAGLVPRLECETELFATLDVIRPGPGALFGPEGLASAIYKAVNHDGETFSRKQIRAAILGGEAALQPLLNAMMKGVEAPSGASHSPIPVIVVDQAEELFLGKQQEENQALLGILRDIAGCENLAAIVIFSIRTDAIDALQRSISFPRSQTVIFALPTFSRAELRCVIEGPLQRQISAKVGFDAALIEALLDDAEATSAESLPLLAFALQSLLRRARPGDSVSLVDYEAIGRLRGCINSACERALSATVAKDGDLYERDLRLSSLRRALIPWLAHLELPDKTPRRRLASQQEIPADSLPLIERLQQERLIAKVTGNDSSDLTFELMHDALFYHWELLKSFMAEEPRFGDAVTRLKEASRNWENHSRSTDWVKHLGSQLDAAEQLYARPDTLSLLDLTDRAYLVACRSKQNAEESNTRNLQITNAEIEQRKADNYLKASDRARRSARLAWVAVAATLPLAAAAALETQRLLLEKKNADALLTRSDLSLDSATVGLNRILKELIERLPAASGEKARVIKELTVSLSNLLENIIKFEPTSHELRRDESVALNLVTQARLANNHVVDALRSAQNSVALMQALTSWDSSNFGWRRDLSVSYERLGDAQLAAGDSDGAIMSYRYDLTIAKALASSSPEASQWRWDMSVSDEKLGDAFLAKGDLKSALSSFTDSRSIRETLVSISPENKSWRRGLAKNYERIGSTHAKIGEVGSAIVSFQRAMEIYSQLTRDDPNDLETLISSIVPRWGLAGLDPPRAKERLAEARAILEKLAAEGALPDEKREWLAQVNLHLPAVDRLPSTAP